MMAEITGTEGTAVEEAAAQLSDAAAAKKCWACGCLHGGLASIERAFPDGKRPVVLDTAIQEARSRLVEVQYDCLGCEICHPAVAINALGRAADEDQIEVDGYPTASGKARDVWPPLPGTYTVLRHGAPVAICTLTDEKLAAALAAQNETDLSIVGTLQTENIGIERIIRNILANPSIRFLVICGADSRQAIGHLPGQSLVALARSGLDEGSRIVGALGKRPVLRNLSPGAVDHFRRTVEVVDLVGDNDVTRLLEVARGCAARNPGPAPLLADAPLVKPAQGYLPTRMVPDPRGYFVIYVDRPRQLLSLEHFGNDGVLDAVIEGKTAPELYLAAIDHDLVSRLDHAAYLGRELSRAERALASGESFIQDAAPEGFSDPYANPACGCGSGSEHGASKDCDT